MQWQDVLADKSLHDLPYKIELNEKGLIEMSPASFIHSMLQGRLAKLLGNQLNGEVFTELAVQTTKGVRVPDVAWGSKEYVQKHGHLLPDELTESSAARIHDNFAKVLEKHAYMLYDLEKAAIQKI